MMGTGRILGVVLVAAACSSQPAASDPAQHVLSFYDDGGSPALPDGGADGALGCFAPTWVGAYGEGSSSQQTTVAGIASDAAGNLYVAGLFTSAVDFGAGPLHASGGADAFVAKLAPNGRVAWGERFGGTGTLQPLGVAVSDTGDRVAVTGTFVGSVTLGGASLDAEDEDMFLLVVDGAGVPLWSKQAGGAGSDHGLAVAFAPDGTLVTSGSFYASIDLGDGAHTARAGAAGGYLAKLDRDGTPVWSRAWDDLVIGSNALAVDPAGEVIFTGFTSSKVDLGGGPLPSHGERDAIVAKLDASGQHVYSASFGSVGDQYGYGVAALGDGSFVVTGGFEAEMDFGLGATLVASSPGPDSFVARFGPSGAAEWAVVGTKHAFGASVAAAKDGEIVVLEDAQEAHGAAVRSGAAVRVLDADGGHARVPLALFGSLDSLGERAIATAAGDTVVAGTYSGSIAICGVDTFVAHAQEVRAYLLDLPPVPR